MYVEILGQGLNYLTGIHGKGLGASLSLKVGGREAQPPPCGCS